VALGSRGSAAPIAGNDPLMAPTHVCIAAAGDLHASEASRARLEEAFAPLEADLVLLAGDLTTHGDPAEAAVLADACRGVDLPVVAVLGNHDHHLGLGDEVAHTLREAGVEVLERAATVVLLEGVEVGIAGTKGFVGGFPGSSLPDFGEPLLRRLYAETTEEALALERGLQEIAHCDLRIALLHYAPIVETIEGEPLGIQTYLGSARLATPIAEYQPDLALHGHAHEGSFEGRIGETPVYNVAVHVTGRDFYVFDLEVTPRRPEIEVRTE
jgi:Icc-related predicted phosphoesterase